AEELKCKSAGGGFQARAAGAAQQEKASDRAGEHVQALQNDGAVNGVTGAEKWKDPKGRIEEPRLKGDRQRIAHRLVGHPLRKRPQTNRARPVGDHRVVGAKEIPRKAEAPEVVAPEDPDVLREEYRKRNDPSQATPAQAAAESRVGRRLQ